MCMELSKNKHLTKTQFYEDHKAIYIALYLKPHREIVFQPAQQI